MAQIVQSRLQKDIVCKRKNPNMAHKVVLRAIKSGSVPSELWQIDCTELPRRLGYKSLLVLVDTFFGGQKTSLVAPTSLGKCLKYCCIK